MKLFYRNKKQPNRVYYNGKEANTVLHVPSPFFYGPQTVHSFNFGQDKKDYGNIPFAKRFCTIDRIYLDKTIKTFPRLVMTQDKGKSVCYGLYSGKQIDIEFEMTPTYMYIEGQHYPDPLVNDTPYFGFSRNARPDTTVGNYFSYAIAFKIKDRKLYMLRETDSAPQVCKQGSTDIVLTDNTPYKIKLSFNSNKVVFTAYKGILDNTTQEYNYEIDNGCTYTHSLTAHNDMYPYFVSVEALTNNDDEIGEYSFINPKVTYYRALPISTDGLVPAVSPALVQTGTATSEDNIADIIEENRSTDYYTYEQEGGCVTNGGNSLITPPNRKNDRFDGNGLNFMISETPVMISSNFVTSHFPTFMNEDYLLSRAENRLYDKQGNVVLLTVAMQDIDNYDEDATKRIKYYVLEREYVDIVHLRYSYLHIAFETTTDPRGNVFLSSMSSPKVVSGETSYFVSSLDVLSSQPYPDSSLLSYWATQFRADYDRYLSIIGAAQSRYQSAQAMVADYTQQVAAAQQLYDNVDDEIADCVNEEQTRRAAISTNVDAFNNYLVDTIQAESLKFKNAPTNNNISDSYDNVYVWQHLCTVDEFRCSFLDPFSKSIYFMTIDKAAWTESNGVYQNSAQPVADIVNPSMVTAILDYYRSNATNIYNMLFSNNTSHSGIGYKLMLQAYARFNSEDSPFGQYHYDISSFIHAPYTTEPYTNLIDQIDAFRGMYDSLNTYYNDAHVAYSNWKNYYDNVYSKRNTWKEFYREQLNNMQSKLAEAELEQSAAKQAYDALLNEGSTARILRDSALSYSQKLIDYAEEFNNVDLYNNKTRYEYSKIDVPPSNIGLATDNCNITYLLNKNNKINNTDENKVTCSVFVNGKHIKDFENSSNKSITQVGNWVVKNGIISNMTITPTLYCSITGFDITTNKNENNRYTYNNENGSVKAATGNNYNKLVNTAPSTASHISFVVDSANTDLYVLLQKYKSSYSQSSDVTNIYSSAGGVRLRFNAGSIYMYSGTSSSSTQLKDSTNAVVMYQDKDKFDIVCYAKKNSYVYIEYFIYKNEEFMYRGTSSSISNTFMSAICIATANGSISYYGNHVMLSEYDSATYNISAHNAYQINSNGGLKLLDIKNASNMYREFTEGSRASVQTNRYKSNNTNDWNQGIIFNTYSLKEPTATNIIIQENESNIYLDNGPFDLSHVETLELSARIENQNSRPMIGFTTSSIYSNLSSFYNNITLFPSTDVGQPLMEARDIPNQERYLPFNINSKVRYIRDKTSGNTTNGGSHWVQLEAITDKGHNIASLACNSKVQFTRRNSNNSNIGWSYNPIGNAYSNIYIQANSLGDGISAEYIKKITPAWEDLTDHTFRLNLNANKSDLVQGSCYYAHFYSKVPIQSFDFNDVNIPFIDDIINTNTSSETCYSMRTSSNGTYKYEYFIKVKVSATMLSTRSGIDYNANYRFLDFNLSVYGTHDIIQEGDSAFQSYVGSNSSGIATWLDSDPQYHLHVDLGKVYDISSIRVKHYYNAYDVRHYYNHVIDVSSDGKNWITIHDSGPDGVQETATGLSYSSKLGWRAGDKIGIRLERQSSSFKVRYFTDTVDGRYYAETTKTIPLNETLYPAFAVHNAGTYLLDPRYKIDYIK